MLRFRRLVDQQLVAHLLGQAPQRLLVGVGGNRQAHDLVQFLGNSPLPFLLDPPDLIQGGGSVVTDGSVLVQDLLDPVPHKGKNLHRLAQHQQLGIFFLFIGLEEMQNGTDGVQALLQSEYLLGEQVGAFHLCLLQCLPVVHEMLDGKVFLSPVDLLEFFHQLKFPHNGCMILHKRHFIHPFPSGIEKAMSLDQLANAVETNFAFKVFRVDQISVFCPPKVIKRPLLSEKKVSFICSTSKLYSKHDKSKT